MAFSRGTIEASRSAAPTVNRAVIARGTSKDSTMQAGDLWGDDLRDCVECYRRHSAAYCWPIYKRVCSGRGT